MILKKRLKRKAFRKLPTEVTRIMQLLVHTKNQVLILPEKKHYLNLRNIRISKGPPEAMAHKHKTSINLKSKRKKNL
jgi:hypothetical protein